MKITALLGSLSLAATLAATPAATLAAHEGVQAAEPQPAAAEFATDVPGISEAMLSADFWIARLGDDRTRMTPEQIRDFNAASFARGEPLNDLDNYPAQLERARVLALIDGTSRLPQAARYYADGRRVPDKDLQALQASLARDAVPAEVAVRWGLVVQRASMRGFPSATPIYKAPDDLDLDRLQETGVFPGQRVALLHESADHQWWFAVNYHYAAWVPKSAIAVGERAQIQSWLAQPRRLVVTGAQVETNFNPEDPRSSRVQLDMGVSLPLLSARDVGFSVHGQNPYASHIVSLPVRDADGRLEFAPTLIARGRDTRVGPLAYRPSQVLRQAFKFLGERYGWGHDYDARDCTGFVGDVYKSFGFLMPRNSGQQGHGKYAPTQFFSDGDAAARATALQRLRVGDLIYIPGHVMMYIGSIAGEPYVIHDVTGLSYFKGDGSYYHGTLSGVSVTPLLPLQLNRDKRYIDRIYAIKTIN